MASKKFTIFKILALIVVCNVFATTASPINKPKESESKLIVISMDGLMFNQIQSDSMPFVLNLYKNGVSCSQMQPVFPTKTLVNHFSIATGLKLFQLINKKMTSIVIKFCNCIFFLYF